MIRHLSEHERQMGSIVNNLPGFVYRCLNDDDWTMLYVSDNCKQITGYSPDDFLNRKKIKYSQLINQEFLVEVDRITGIALSEKKNFEVEYVISSADKTPKWLLERGTGVFDESGSLLFIEGYIEDVSERKLKELEILQSREALRESMENYHHLINGMNETVWVIGDGGEILDVNKSALEMMQYTFDELKSIGILALDAYLSKAQVDELVIRLKSQNTHIFETYHRVKSGKTIPVEICSSMVNYQGKRAILCIGRDITARKEMEKRQREQELQKKKLYDSLLIAKEKAEESDRLKMAFLANMSHEIRTPMNGILGFMELIGDVNIEEQSRQEYIELVNISGQRLLSTINDIIEISKIESGQREVCLETVCIEEVMEFYHDFFKPQADEKSLRLSVINQLKGNLSKVVTDRHKIDSILTNLIRNAIKFTTNGSIEIGNYIESGSLVFYIRDSGSGIALEKQGIIFERFIQADTHMARTYEGSGLGLSIAKAYVEILGGTIWVESELNKGSTFFFSIPYQPFEKDDKLNAVFENRIQPTISKGITCLVAEDDEISYRYLAKLFSQLGINIIRAYNGKEAVQLVKDQSSISLVLMDIKMPIMDGLEATRQIRQFNNALVIIAQTAYALPGDREIAREAGCSDYLSKPIKRDELLKMLEKWKIGIATL